MKELFQKHKAWFLGLGFVVLYVIYKAKQTAPAIAASNTVSSPVIDTSLQDPANLPASGAIDYSGEIQTLHDDIALLAQDFAGYITASGNTGNNNSNPPASTGGNPPTSNCPAGYYIDVNGNCVSNTSTNPPVTGGGGGSGGCGSGMVLYGGICKDISGPPQNGLCPPEYTLIQGTCYLPGYGPH